MQSWDCFRSHGIQKLSFGDHWDKSWKSGAERFVQVLVSSLGLFAACQARRISGLRPQEAY
jgi:hypothetical protein